MKKILVRVAVTLVVILVGIVSFAYLRFAYMADRKFPRPEFSIREEVAKADKDLGERIYHVRAGCVDCHGSG